MIPSVDTYLYHEIESKLRILMSNRYIIEEILKGVQPKIAQNFMRAYVEEGCRGIPIVYTMPQDKQTQQGAIYIGLREGQETHPSLGNLEDTYSYQEDLLHKEPSTIQYDPKENKCFLEVEHEIGELVNVENLAFAASDNVEVVDIEDDKGKRSRIYFKYDPDLLGLDPFNVIYEGKVGNEKGFKVGFTTTEHYSVLVVSTNMDTVRCLDLIVKSILILMRNNPEELNNTLLQRLQFGQIEEVPTGRQLSDNVPELLYGRETIVSYRVSYSLDAPLLQTLDAIKIKVQ